MKEYTGKAIVEQIQNSSLSSSNGSLSKELEQSKSGTIRIKKEFDVKFKDLTEKLLASQQEVTTIKVNIHFKFIMKKGKI